MRVHRRSFRIVAIIAVLVSLLASAMPAAAVQYGKAESSTTSAPGEERSSGRIRTQHTGNAQGNVSHSLKPASDVISADEFKADQQRIDPHPNQVIGEDERYQLSPANPRVAYLDINDGMASCSGTFVGPNVLLTAAHCLWHPDLGGWIGSARVVPGKDSFSEPHGFDYAVTAWVTESWVNSGAEDVTWDWGLLILETGNLGNSVGHYTLGVLQTPTLQSASFNPAIVGYPGDKSDATQWMGQKNSFLEIEDFLLYHDIDTFSGQSGSAVFRGADSMIVGVHTNGTPTFNIAQRVDPEMLDYLNDGCANNGCTISSYTEPTTDTPNPADAFWRTWARTDKPVDDGHVIRTWMWGPQPFTGILQEPYGGSPGGMRSVQYYDKSRMEVNDPFGNPNEPWYVTNGLLSLEMIVGKTETAPGEFDQSPHPAQVGVAGDPNDSQGPTYATFTSLLKAPKLAGGSVITQRVDRSGNVTNDGSLAGYGVTALDVSPEVGSWVDFSQHAIASVFWAFMNSEGLVEVNGQLVTDKLFPNPFYGTGLAVTEPYWTTVQVGGTQTVVLVQCFERRCLTYTPSNDPTWRVEAGNVGQHYYTWRHDQPSNGVPADQNALYAWDSASWSSYQDTNTTITPTGNALHFRTNTDIPIFGWWDAPTADYSVRADVRLVDGGGAAPDSTFACITARLTADFGENYALCIYADGWISAGYEYFDDQGAYHFDPLVENGYLDSVGPVSGWNTLKIVIQGDDIWFLVNGTVIGSATHNGPGDGVPSMYIVSLDGAWVEWAFTNFNVYSLT